MNLRDAVWNALSQLADELDALVMGRRSLPDLDGVLHFTRQLRSILRRLTQPKSRLRGPSLVRELEALEGQCVSSLRQFTPLLNRAVRLAHALVERNRRVMRNRQGAGA